MGQNESVTSPNDRVDLVTWSPEKAWMAGVVYGDGHVDHRKGRRRVTLVGGDLDLIEKWVAVIGKGVIRKRTSGRTWAVEVGDIELSGWFASYGLDGKKSGNLLWPEDLPKNLVVHFVRGLWDTDGSVLWKQGLGNRADSLRLTYVSKTKAFVERVICEVPFPLTLERQSRRTGPYRGWEYWVATLGGRGAEEFFRWLYTDAPVHLRLERKYQVGVDFLEWVKSATQLCARCGREVRGRLLCKHCQRVKCEGVVCSVCEGTPVIARGLCRSCYGRRRAEKQKVWEDPRTIKYLEGFSFTDWALKSSDEQEADIRRISGIYFEKGFPWELVKRRDEPDVLSRVRRGRVGQVDVDTIGRVGWAGQVVCLAAHPHRLEARHRVQKLSVAKAFKSQEMLERAVRFQLEHGDPVTPHRVIGALLALLRGPLNFPPVLARWLVDTYAPDNGIIFDPCSGYGGRLLGSLTSSRNVSYIGYDPEPRTVKGNLRLVKWLSCGNRVQARQQAVEDDVLWPDASLVLTSPPYYDREVYGDATETLLRRYRTFHEWVRGFLSDLIRKSFIAAPVLILNVAVVRSGQTIYNIPEVVSHLVEENGGMIDKVWNWRLQSFGAVGNVEKIIVARRR